MSTYTVESYFRTPNILRGYTQILANTAPMTSFYGLTPGNASIRTPFNDFGADIFNMSRLIAHGRAPEAGPGTVRRKPTGKFSGTLLRLHEKMQLTDNSIANMRPYGTPVGTLDRTGQRYVARQLNYLLQRYANAREFVVSRMLRGGFGILSSGEDQILVESGNGDFDVDFQIPSGNKTTVGGLFPSDSWDTTTTDIPEQFLGLNAHAERVWGGTPSVAWINYLGYVRLLQNTKIQSYRGTANRVFDLQTRRQVKEVTERGSRSSGFLVKFEVMPQITFIVHDGVLNVNQKTDSTAAVDSSKFIPDGKMIVTPAPGLGDWVDMAEGGEMVREHKADTNPQWRWGFYSWTEPTTQPAGREIICRDSFMPFLAIPAAVYYIDIYVP